MDKADNFYGIETIGWEEVLKEPGVEIRVTGEGMEALLRKLGMVDGGGYIALRTGERIRSNLGNEVEVGGLGAVLQGPEGAVFLEDNAVSYFVYLAKTNRLGLG